MKQGYSHQFESASVVIETGENPSITELIDYAHAIRAIWHNEEDGIDIVIDDENDHSDRGVGAELYEQSMLEEMVQRGQTTFRTLVS